MVKEHIAKTPHQGIAFRLLKHKQNSGLSVARNTGTAASAGDFIYYLDSDDVITPECIELLEKPMEEDNWDLVTADYDVVGKIDETKVILTDREIKENEIADSYGYGWHWNAWNKLCSRKFLTEHKLAFIPGIYYEDVPWTFKIACTAEKIKVLGKPTYHYYVRPSSIMNSAKAEKSYNSYCRVLAAMRGTQWQYHNFNYNLEDRILCIQTCISEQAEKCGKSPKKVYNIFRHYDRRPWLTRLHYYLRYPRLLPFNFHWLLPISLGYLWNKYYGFWAR